VNLFQRFVESLLFFHPMIWLVSNWIRREREFCCDELVVVLTKQPHEYAENLVFLADRAAEKAQRGRLLPSPTAVSSMAEHPLLSRIRRIMKKEDQTMQVSRKAVTLTISTVLAVGIVLGWYYTHASYGEDSLAKNKESLKTTPQEVLLSLRANDARFDNLELKYLKIEDHKIKPDRFHYWENGMDANEMPKDYWDVRTVKWVRSCSLVVRDDNTIIASQSEPGLSEKDKYVSPEAFYKEGIIEGSRHMLNDMQLADNDPSKNTPNYAKQYSIEREPATWGIERRMEIEFPFGIGFGKRIQKIDSIIVKNGVRIVTGVIKIWSEDISRFEIELDENDLVRKAVIRSDVNGHHTQIESTSKGTVCQGELSLAQSGSYRRGSPWPEQRPKDSPWEYQNDFRLEFRSATLNLSDEQYEKLAEFKIEPLMQVDDEVNGVRGTGAIRDDGRVYVKPSGGDDVLARVGEEAIYSRDITPQIDRYLAQFKDKLTSEEINMRHGEFESKRDELIKKSLQAAVESKLIFQDAKRELPEEGMTAVEKQIGNVFDKKELPKLIKREGVVNAEELENKLQAQGNSVEQEKQNFFEKVLVSEWARRKLKKEDAISRAEAESYYATHRNEFLDENKKPLAFLDAQVEVRKKVTEARVEIKFREYLNRLKSATKVWTKYDPDEEKTINQTTTKPLQVLPASDDAVAKGVKPDAEKITITVNVVDENGLPMAGASVGKFIPGEAAPSDLKTDANGSYQFPPCEPGEYKFVAATADYPPVGCFYKADTEHHSVKIQLQLGKPIRLKIVDRSGAPIANASIGHFGCFPEHYMLTAPKTTDAEGRWNCMFTPDEKIELDITAKGCPRTVKVVTTDDREQVIELTETLWTAACRVVDAQTKTPITKIRVSQGCPTQWPSNENQYLWNRQQTLEDTEGKFKVEWDLGSPPLNVLRIEADGYLPSEDRSVSREEKNVEWNVELNRGEPVTGVVRSIDNQPLAGAKVILCTETRPFIMYDNNPEQPNDSPPCITDSEGRFSFGSQREFYVLVALHDQGFGMLEQSPNAKDIVVKPWARAEGTIKIDDLFAIKKPIFLECCYQAPPGNEPESILNRMNVHYRVNPDKDGHFVFDRLPSGKANIAVFGRATYNLQGEEKTFWADNLLSSSSVKQMPIELHPGETKKVDIEVADKNKDQSDKSEIPNAAPPKPRDRK
jgi:hypothetical protein